MKEENTSKNKIEANMEQQIYTLRRCICHADTVEIDGKDYTVMSIFDRRDTETVAEKIKYLISAANN